jgi:23S rRNA (pseudouridine1915-N3)-methyltransferase
MTTIHIIAVGKDKDAWVSEGLAHYTKLLSRWSKVEWTLLTSRRSSHTDANSIRKAEAELILPKIVHRPTIALADSGKPFNTMAFAKALAGWQTKGGGRFTFVIGGPYGLHADVIDAAETVVSLSPLTFSHQVVRLVLMEQLYRGFSILHNTDYHK